MRLPSSSVPGLAIVSVVASLSVLLNILLCLPVAWASTSEGELDDGPALSSTSPAAPVPGPEDGEVDVSKPCDLEVGPILRVLKEGLDF